MCYKSVDLFWLPGPVKRSRKDNKLYPVEVVEFDSENQREASFLYPLIETCVF